MDSSLQRSSSSNEPNAPGNIAAMMLVPAQQSPAAMNLFAIGTPSSGQQTQTSASSSDEDNSLAVRGASRPIQRSRPHSTDSRRAAVPYNLPTNQPRPAFTPPSFGDADVLIQEASQTNVCDDGSQSSTNTMSIHQRNLQVNNQANTQVTNVH